MTFFAIVLFASGMLTFGADAYESQSTGAIGRPSRPPVAIVSSLEGRIMIERPGQELASLEHFQWLDAGSSIVVHTGSHVTLVFVNGTRVQLGPASTATLGVEGLSRSSGPIKALESLPALPKISPIARAAHPPPGGAAIRVRGPRIERLIPSAGEVTLAERTVLEFHVSGGPAGYSVQVEDEKGGTLFQVETADSRVPIPVGTLTPGTRYHWTVVGRTGLGQTFRNSAEFTTLSVSDQQARDRLRAQVAGTADARALAFLAEIDRALNMTTEAREGLRSALALSPDDPVIRAALRRLEQPAGNP